MGAKNKVIAGDYDGEKLMVAQGQIGIPRGISYAKWIWFTRATIATFDPVDSSQQTSASSAVLRGGIGAALLGPIGIAAALSAKKKGIHTVAVELNDGKRCLLEIDEKLYKILQKEMF